MSSDPTSVCVSYKRIRQTQFTVRFLLFSLHRFKNVIFEISPSEAVGVFDVKAKLMGVHLETLQIEYQVSFLTEVLMHSSSFSSL